MKPVVMTLCTILVAVPATALAERGHEQRGGLPALERRVEVLEAALAAPTEIAVACPSGSIADAVSRAVPGTPLTVVVSGRCSEPRVVVTRDDVTIEGAERGDGLDGELRVVGAKRVTLRNLTMRNDDGTAVSIREGATARLEDVTASGDLVSAPNSGLDGYGVVVSRNAYADLVRVDASVGPGGNNALLLNDGAAARATDGSYVSLSNTPFDNTAIGLFRQASLRMVGEPLIENRNTLVDPDPLRHVAVQVAHTSNMRINDEIGRIVGTVHVTNNSAARIRRLGGPAVGPGILDGSVLIALDSNLEIGTRLAATVTGSVQIQDQSLLNAQGPGGSIVVQGGVICGGPDPDGGIVNPSALSPPLPPGAGCKRF